MTLRKVTLTISKIMEIILDLGTQMEWWGSDGGGGGSCFRFSEAEVSQRQAPDHQKDPEGQIQGRAQRVQRP